MLLETEKNSRLLLQVGALAANQVSPCYHSLWCSDTSILQYSIFTRKSSVARLSIHPDLQAEEETGEHSFWVSAPLTLLGHMFGTSMPLYPFCVRLIALPLEKPNKVCAGHTKQLKSTTHTKLQAAFSRTTAALGKCKRTRDEVA